MIYLYESKSFFEEKEAFDLYFALEYFLSEKVMSFSEIIFRFSQGISIAYGPYTILLDEDWDTPDDNGTVEIYVGETSSILDIKTYVLLVGYVCINYLKFYPEDRKRIDRYIEKINNRYEEFLT